MTTLPSIRPGRDDDAAGFIGKAETHWPGLTAGN